MNLSPVLSVNSVASEKRVVVGKFGEKAIQRAQTNACESAGENLGCYS